jgi:hypothetical protein
MGAAGDYSVVNWQEREADNSPPSIADVNNFGAKPPLPNMFSLYNN